MQIYNDPQIIFELGEIRWFYPAGGLRFVCVSLFVLDPDLQEVSLYFHTFLIIFTVKYFYLFLVWLKFVDNLKYKYGSYRRWKFKLSLVLGSTKHFFSNV